MNLFQEISRTNKAYCASLGLPSDTYDRPLAEAEANGTPLSAAEAAIARLNSMPKPPLRVRPSSVPRCIVQYARPAACGQKWEELDIGSYYDDCRAKRGQRAGVFVGD